MAPDLDRYWGYISGSRTIDRATLTDWKFAIIG